MNIPKEIKYTKVVRGLSRLGFSEVGCVGSHLKMTNGKVNTTIPIHSKPVSSNTTEKIRKDLGMERKDFYRHF